MVDFRPYKCITNGYKYDTKEVFHRLTGLYSWVVFIFQVWYWYCDLPQFQYCGLIYIGMVFRIGLILITFVLVDFDVLADNVFEPLFVRSIPHGGPT